MSQPLVSIIIPAYNAGKYIARTIEGVMRQTIADWELIIVDDGSKDDTPGICDTFASKDSRIRVVHKSNGGVSAARNTGLDEAQGRYITFLDADDFFVPQYLEALTHSIGRAEMSAFPYKEVCSDGELPSAFEEFEPTSEQYTLQEGYILLVKKNLLHSPYCKLFVNEIVTKNVIRFEESVAMGEDLLFNLAYLENVKTLAIGNQKVYYYIRENSQLSRDIRADYAELQIRFYQDKAAFCERHHINYSAAADRFGILYDAFASVAKSQSISKKNKLHSLKNIQDSKMVKDYLQQNSPQSAKEFLFRLMLRAPHSLLKFIV